jgi:hypothetical protein
MAAITRRSKVHYEVYIGATSKSVYLRHTDLTLFREPIEKIWAAPRVHFSEADFKILEQSRSRH